MRADVAALTADTFRELGPDRRALARLDDEIVATQVRIAGIPAPTGAEQRRAAWVSSYLRDAGYDARIDDAGNVVARLAGAYAGEPVVVCAHLDTVFPEETDLAVRHEGSRLVGPGICDNGRGLAVMLTIARGLWRRAGALARAVDFVATTGEEGTGDLRGVRHYLARDARPSALIAIDGAGDERIVNAGLAARRLRVRYHGPGGHSWTAFGSANPVHAAARAAAQIADLRVRAPARVTLTVSRIGGGMAVNAIPEDGWLEVDMRSTSTEAVALAERQVCAIASAAADDENAGRLRGTPALTAQVERIGDRPGGETHPDSPLVSVALAATGIIGATAELAAASTDANAAMALGVPAITIGGGGSGGDAHSTREWFDNTNGLAGIDRALTVVATMARLTSD